MTYKRFPSLAFPDKYAYAYDSGNYDSRSTAVDSHFRMYETYGDGLTAHSPDWGITTEYLADYLFSLASFARSDDEFLQDLYFTMHRVPSDREIEFAASVIFKPVPEEKRYSKNSRRYFSLKERKLSSADAKEFDKRYTEITDRFDGSAKSIIAVLLWDKMDWVDTWERFQTVTAVYDWIQKQDGSGLWMEMPVVYLEWFKTDRANERENARDIQSAYRILQHLTEAYRLREMADTSISHYANQCPVKFSKCERIFLALWYAAYSSTILYWVYQLAR